MFGTIFWIVLAAFVFFRIWKTLGATKIMKIENTEQMNEIVDSIFKQIEKQKKTQTEASTEENKIFEKNANKNVIVVKEAFPDFESDLFIENAKVMFNTVFESFAQAKLDILKSLLDKDLYEKFLENIKKRDQKKLKQEIEIKHLKTTIQNIKKLSKKIKITVLFEVSQMSAILNQEGKPLDNPARIFLNVTHKWILERIIGSNDSSWILVSTTYNTN